MTSAQAIELCEAASLQQGGDGHRFDLQTRHGRATGFVVRTSGGLRAYLNQCSHVPTELDWQPGKFFDLTGHFLGCSVHGAWYEATSGRCSAGPCRGPLVSLVIEERDGRVWWLPDDRHRPVPVAPPPPLKKPVADAAQQGEDHE